MQLRYIAGMKIRRYHPGDVLALHRANDVAAAPMR